MPELWLAGYGAWPSAARASGLVGTLKDQRVSRLVDVRLSPCASDPSEGRPYGPKPWNPQAGRGGLVGWLADAGIGYEWPVELGNPRRRDRSMAILRSHLADPSGRWPVHRGLDRLAGLVREPGSVVALLCACGDARACHRLVVAQALADRHFGGELALRDVKTGATFPRSPTMDARPGS